MKDIYTEITNKIIDALKKGTIPWHKPWGGASNWAVSHSTGKPYSLLNQMLLRQGEYITFNQVKAEGGKVKKGSKASMIVFWKMIPKEIQDLDGNPVMDKDGKPVIKTIPILRYYNVFHLDDVEGIEPKYINDDEFTHKEPIEEAEKVANGYIERSGVKFENYYQDEAYYSPSQDKIVLPIMEQFENVAEYYSTLFHEMTHSTGHKSRLDRFEKSAGAAMFGSESYSKEELVAEIGSATLMSSIGIDTDDTFNNSAAYIQGWLNALRNDKKLIVSAASKAEKAVKMILNTEEVK